MTSKFQKLWEGYLRDRFIILIVVAIIWASLPRDVSYYFESQFRVVVLFSYLIGEILERTYKYPLSESFMALGIPAGIFGAEIAVVSIFEINAELAGDINMGRMTPLIAALFLAVMYGLCIAAIGYVLQDAANPKSDNLPISKKVFRLCLAVFFSVVVYAISEGGGLISIISQMELFFCIGIALVFVLFRNKTGLAENLVDAALMMSVIGIMISIVELYSSFRFSGYASLIEPQEFFRITNYANYCLLYGTGVYIFAFLLSLKTNEVNLINFKLRNWHLLEAFSFYVFMTMAAPGIFELV